MVGTWADLHTLCERKTDFGIREGSDDGREFDRHICSLVDRYSNFDAFHELLNILQFNFESLMEDN